MRDVLCQNSAKTVIALSKDGYPELEEKKGHDLKGIWLRKKNKFNKTIDQGLDDLRRDWSRSMVAEGKTVLAGADAFKLYDTYGFPLDLTLEILEDKDFTVDEDGFQAAMKSRERSAESTESQQLHGR